MSLKHVVLSSTPYLPAVVRNRMVPPKNQWTREHDRSFVKGSNATRSLLIGPKNTAGQGERRASAVRTLPGANAVSFQATPGGVEPTFQVDVRTSISAMRHSPAWSRGQSRSVFEGFTHVIYESATPMLGVRFQRDLEREVSALLDHGVQVALAWYGSDIRRPSTHRQLYVDSPFHNDLGGLTERLEVITQRNSAIADKLGLIEFNSGPDLNLYRPGSIWLPTLHDSALWSRFRRSSIDADCAARRQRPVVVHIPSRANLKGTALIRAEMEILRDTVDYRELEGLTPEQVADCVAQADIVIDQVSMGVFGVTSLEAMFLGKPVIAEVGPAMRGGIERAIGSELPIVEACASNIADVVRGLAMDPDLRYDVGLKGRHYVEDIHSPSNVARVINEHFLNQ